MNTSDIIDGCNCGGLFPVPPATCLDELAYLDKNTRYRCFDSGGSAFFTDLVSFFNIQSNYDWWKDYLYATKTKNDGFDRIVMNYVKVLNKYMSTLSLSLSLTTLLFYCKVQTTLSENDADFVEGLELVDKWDKWAERYNKRMKTLAATAGQPEPTKAMVYISQATQW